MSSTTDATRTPPAETDPEVEMWESTIAGRIYVTRLDSRGNEQAIPVPGHGRLRIRRRDRVLNQETVLDPRSDVFSNGKLRRIGPGHETSPDEQLQRREYTPEALGHVIGLSEPAFRAVVDDMDERGVRALKAALPTMDGTMSQAEYVQGVIASKFQPHSRSMPSSAELITDPEDDSPF